jgi:hypothetical protein
LISHIDKNGCDHRSRSPDGLTSLNEHDPLKSYEDRSAERNAVSQPSKESRERNELRKFPMMPIRDVVIFPFMMTPFVVGRDSSVRALEEALTGDRKIFLATQHDASVDEPSASDIYQVGTVANIVQSLRCRTETSRCWWRAWNAPGPSK